MQLTVLIRKLSRALFPRQPSMVSDTVLLTTEPKRLCGSPQKFLAVGVLCPCALLQIGIKCVFLLFGTLFNSEPHRKSQEISEILERNVLRWKLETNAVN